MFVRSDEVSITDAAAMLGVTRLTVSNLCRRGILKVRRRDGRRFPLLASVIEYRSKLQRVGRLKAKPAPSRTRPCPVNFEEPLGSDPNSPRRMLWEWMNEQRRAGWITRQQFEHALDLDYELWQIEAFEEVHGSDTPIPARAQKAANRLYELAQKIAKQNA